MIVCVDEKYTLVNDLFSWIEYIDYISKYIQDVLLGANWAFFISLGNISQHNREDIKLLEEK